MSEPMRDEADDQPRPRGKLSLKPLEFEEALEALLQVDPEADEEST